MKRQQLLVYRLDLSMVVILSNKDVSETFILLQSVSNTNQHDELLTNYNNVIYSLKKKIQEIKVFLHVTVRCF